MSVDDGLPVASVPENQLPKSLFEAKCPDDRRNSFRMVADTRAVLRVRRREYAVELADQSRGGFSVWIVKSPSFRVNQQAFLRTTRGWSSVRIAYLEKARGRYRVGLEFLADLEDSRETELKVRGGRWWSRMHDLVFFFGALALGSAVAFVIIAHDLFPHLEIWRHFGR